jgi:hypothetical protein
MDDEGVGLGFDRLLDDGHHRVDGEHDLVHVGGEVSDHEADWIAVVCPGGRIDPLEGRHYVGEGRGRHAVTLAVRRSTEPRRDARADASPICVADA